MKKTKYLLTMILTAFLCAGMLTANAYADEPKTVEETVEEETEKTLAAPWEYGEIKDGLFVRSSILEELSWIPDSMDSNDYMEEMRKCIDARKMDALTPEMEAAGYVLFDGIAYTPEEWEQQMQGDAPESENQEKEQEEILNNPTEITEWDENGNPIVKYNYGYVTFKGTVQPEIHERVFIEVTNTSSNKIFKFNLFEENSYVTSVQLPSGTYIFSGGGITKDYKSEYPVSGNNFTVKAGEPVVVAFTVGNIDEDAVKNGVVVEINEPGETEETVPKENTESEIKEKKSFSMSDLIVRFIIVVIMAIIVFVVYRKFKKVAKK